jgi:hypothetical protein
MGRITVFDLIKSILKPVTERLINKYTPKGISTLLVGVILHQIGVSDEIMMLALAYDWNFIELFYKWTFEHRVLFSSICVALVAIGGFYILRRDLNCIHQNKLMVEKKNQENTVEILKLKIEEKKLQKELEKIENKTKND